MGTRHLTCVFYKGEYKVAQYGQWDGYPSATGSDILSFLESVNMDEFKEKVSSVRWMNDNDIEKLNDTNWTQTHPHLSRDAGSKVLFMIMDGAEFVKNSLSFAGSSLFCEWAYVIDLDDMNLEVYRGFNREKITDGRFKSGDESLEIDEGYEPVKLVKIYDMNGFLPTAEKLCEECDPDDEE